MSGEDARTAAMHQPINDLEDIFGTRLGFNKAFRERNTVSLHFLSAWQGRAVCHCNSAVAL